MHFNHRQHQGGAMKAIALNLFSLGLLALSASHTALAADGLVTKSSKHSVAITMDRIESVAKEKGMIIFARIDHGAGAEKVGLKMPAAQVMIFGNPKGGTPLMLASPSTALDLPLRVAVWEDAQGKVWVGYNSVSFVKERHSIAGKDELVKTLDGALDGITNKALE
jgi:uncharacterized protein (DUF302 family)